MARSPVEYLLIGHVNRDLLPDGGYMPGGTVAYAGLTAAVLGKRVGVITCAAPDVDLGGLENVAQVLCHPAAETTTFENLYTPEGRIQRLHGLAPSLSPAHVPEVWRTPDIVHIGPVMNECDPNLVELFTGRTFVGVTSQGWLRSADHAGRIHPQTWASAAQVLPHASAVVVSIEDLGGDWALAEAWAAQTPLLVVTAGQWGGALFAEGRRSDFSVSPLPEVDATGAGDIFAAACFSALAAGEPPAAAVAFAACLAGRSVCRVGVASAPRREDLAACAQWRNESWPVQ